MIHIGTILTGLICTLRLEQAFILDITDWEDTTVIHFTDIHIGIGTTMIHIIMEDIIHLIPIIHPIPMVVIMATHRITIVM